MFWEWDEESTFLKPLQYEVALSFSKCSMNGANQPVFQDTYTANAPLLKIRPIFHHLVSIVSADGIPSRFTGVLTQWLDELSMLLTRYQGRSAFP
jgi:hypothetical protein